MLRSPRSSWHGAWPCILLVVAFAGCTGARHSLSERTVLQLDLPPQTKQVVVSLTDDWQATTSTVHCFDLVDGAWQIALPHLSANVGRSGLGWGCGLHVDGIGPLKREGDGRAPAGIFSLGTAFGYAVTPPEGVEVPYRQATDRDYFVDAADSDDYNRWRHIDEAQPNDPQRHWQSCERMRRDDGLYEIGVVVNHNTEDIEPGRGSAIFLHVWPEHGSPTSGCTAMSRSDLLRVMRWLDPAASPLLVQMPASELPALALRR